jgi:hypothetical protein
MLKWKCRQEMFAEKVADLSIYIYRQCCGKRWLRRITGLLITPYGFARP